MHRWQYHRVGVQLVRKRLRIRTKLPIEWMVHQIKDYMLKIADSIT